MNKTITTKVKKLLKKKAQEKAKKKSKSRKDGMIEKTLQVSATLADTEPQKTTKNTSSEETDDTNTEGMTLIITEHN